MFQRYTFRKVIITYFGLVGKIDSNSKFSHFTDLNRCAGTETLKELTRGNYKHVRHMYNADKLYSGGVKFEAVENKLSLDVRFENGCLKIPCLLIEDRTEMELRNVIALEQCHYPNEDYVCNYINFLKHLIDTDKDVDLLVEKGIIKNWIGQHSLVAEMVNKLNVGIITCGSCYYDIAAQVNTHYTNRYQRSKAILKRVYFGNLWIGTASVAAVLLLLMTLIQTVASIIQVMQNTHNN
ncbi:hypothetical protein V5N11_020794 [Cardamine amara subsp. amara]|uniref:Uncharacterized protein n=1 Tax=Cardamine amara subsp. amara TaxID=228776 RepID=A0ABD1AQE0_CARAN